MRNSILIYGGLSFALIGLINQSVFATTPRYPTFEEATEAITDFLDQTFPEHLRLPIYSDNRTPEQIQEVFDFTRSWSQFSPNTALFLGEWHGSSGEKDLMVAVYPSNNSSGRVCVLQYLESDNSYTFGVGHLEFNRAENGAQIPNEFQIKVAGGLGFIRVLRRMTEVEGEHMLQVAVTTDNQVIAGGHVAFPRPLREPRSFLPENINFRNYEIARCTTSLPEFRSGSFPNTQMAAGETTDEGVTFRFTGAYVSDSPTSQSVEAYWAIENLGDRPFAFYPNAVKVVTANGEEIECPDAVLPEGVGAEMTGCARANIDEGYDGFIEPGETVTGRVLILRQASELNGLFLMVPNAISGDRQFQVPIQLGSRIE